MGRLAGVAKLMLAGFYRNTCPQSAFVEIAFVEIAMLVCEQALGKFIPFRYRSRDRSLCRPVMRRHTRPQPLRDDAGVEETMLRHRAIEMPDRCLQNGPTLRRFLIEPANVRDNRFRTSLRLRHW